MTIEKAFQRLSWRFSNGKFEPNDNDVQALKFIADWVNREKKETLHSQKLFQKMYVYCFFHELAFYKDVHFAQKKLHEVLQLSVARHYSDFCKKLNSVELEKFKKSIGINPKHPVLLSPEENSNDEMLILEHAAELERYVQGVWDQEKVNTSLNNQISEAINKYKDLP